VRPYRLNATVVRNGRFAQTGIITLSGQSGCIEAYIDTGFQSLDRKTRRHRETTSLAQAR